MKNKQNNIEKLKIIEREVKKLIQENKRLREENNKLKNKIK